MSLRNILKKLTKLVILSPIVLNVLAKLFKICAITGEGSNICLKNGFLPMPVNFYSPVPDIEDLKNRNIWDTKSELVGIDFNVNEQTKLLTKLGLKYSNECQWPLTPRKNTGEYYVQNPSFSYGCAASTHCIIRNFKPNTIIEIGSGMSSRVISSALKMNYANDGHKSDYIIVDPYPNDFIKNRSIEIKNLIETRVELTQPLFFDQLKQNDILFIDSGHSVRIGADVNYLLLEILPRLKPGVIVHIHDINIPYEYPKVYATNETFRQFWTEQYLLQSFLCFNNQFEILLAMNYLMKDHSAIFKKYFPYYNPEVHLFNSGSFWIRKIS
jgi:hypothetical protein